MAASLVARAGLRVLKSNTFQPISVLATRGYLASIAGQPGGQSTGVLAAHGEPNRCGLHTSSALCWERPTGPRKFLTHNQTVFPPTPFGEQPRPAFVCHMKKNIKYSPSKMWYVACLVRGLRIDDAINQLKFVHKKGSVAARETLEEAKELAVKEHNVEFASNLWVSESFVGKGMIIRGYRRHARRRFGKVEYKYCHYFVTLEEGDPPEHYYPFRRPRTPQELLEEWMEEQRRRTIIKSL